MMRKKTIQMAWVSSMVISTCAMAAEPISLEKTTISTLLATHPFVRPSVKNEMISTGNALKIRSSRKDKNKIEHLRVQQYYFGVRVFGVEGVIHSKNEDISNNLAKLENNQVKMTGQLFGQLSGELGQPSNSYLTNGHKALKKFKSTLSSNNLSEESVEKVVYVDKKNQAHWAYLVQVTISHTDAIPEKPTAVLDAESYQPYVQWNDIKTLSAVKGFGYGGNHKVLKYQFGLDRPALNITRNKSIDHCFMDNEVVTVVDMQHGYGSLNKPMEFFCPFPDSMDNTAYWTGYHSDGYDMENGAYSPANDAMFAGEVIYGLYKNWFDVYALSDHKDKPMKIVMRVHYGSSYENAFWDGRQMTFGDGADHFHPLVSLGVGAHEVSHGFTQQNSDLMYYGESGGMNESFSDMAAQAAEYYAVQTNSWTIGAEITKADSGMEALRYMDLPSRDGRSIDSADEYEPGINVHYSSGVYNRFFYLLATSPNWNTQKAFHVMVKANMDYWTPFTDFDEGACGVLNAARDLGYSKDALLDAFGKVGLNTQSCQNGSFSA